MEKNRDFTELEEKQKFDIAELLSIIDSLRAGLSYYADEIAWKDTGRTKSIAGSREFIVYESFDGGELARAILEKEKP